MWGCDYSASGLGQFFHGGMMPPFFVVLLLVCIALVVALVMTRKNATTPNTSEFRDKTDSLSILKARFANGDIDEDTYNKMKSVLSRP